MRCQFCEQTTTAQQCENPECLARWKKLAEEPEERESPDEYTLSTQSDAGGGKRIIRSSRNL